MTTHRSWIVTALLCALVIAGGFVPFGKIPEPGYVSPHLPLLVVAAAALVFRQRWTFVVHGVCLAVFAVAAFTGEFSPAYVFPVGLSLYAVAVSTGRRVAVLVAAGSAVFVAAVSIAVSSSPLTLLPTALGPGTVQVVAVLLFAAAAGDATRSRRAYIAAIIDSARQAELSREAETTRRVAEERLSIARDLHDRVAHQIAVINLHAGAASRALRTRPDDAEKSLGVVHDAAKAVIEEIGDLLAVLRTSPGRDDSQVAGPPVGMDAVGDLLERFRESGLQVAYRVSGTPVLLAPAVDDVAYRAISEALTNAHKHGSDARAELSVEHGLQALTITIRNRFDASESSDGSVAGHGLIGMRERLLSVDGSVSSTVIPGDTFELVVEVPVVTVPVVAGPVVAGPIVSGPALGAPARGERAAP